MAQIGAFTIIIPMEAVNFRGGNNLLSPPRHSSFALHSRSYTINRSSTPSSTIICQAKHQPIFERKRLGKQKPRSGNLRLEEVPTIFKITKALATTAKLGKYGAALSQFNKLQLEDIELNLYTFGIAINCYCCVNRVGFGLSLLGTIFKRGYTPDLVIFNTLLKGLIAQHKAAEALSHFNKLQLLDIELNLNTFNIAINCYCRMNRVGFGFSLLGGIFKYGYTPYAVTFTTLLNGFIAQDKVAEAMRVFNTMVDRGIQPTIRSYNILIRGYCDNMKIDEAIDLFREIPQRGLKPNLATFTTIFTGISRLGRFTVALELLNAMELAGLTPESRTYGMLLSGLCNTGHIDEALSLFHMIENKGLGLNIVIYYNIIIGAFCKNNNLESARDFFIKLSSKGLQPNFITYDVMIRGLCKEGFLDEAKELLVKMDQNGVLPDSGTYKAIIQGFVEQQK